MNKVCVIGGGITGLTVAKSLSGKYKVTVFEKGAKTGGLAGCYKVNGVYLEKYYHHFFTSDKPLINLLSELGFADRILWKKSSVGIYYESGLYSFCKPLDLLKFSPLKMLERIKLGLSIVYLERTNDWHSMDNVTAREWFTKKFGGKIYSIVWEPLLKLKFGEDHDKISAAFLWGRIKPRAKSRTGGNERLGYLEGGFISLFNKMEEVICNSGGRIHKKKPIRSIKKKNGKFVVETTRERFFFDKIISTIPLPEFLKIEQCLPDAQRDSFRKVRYKGIICMSLFSKKDVSPFYWLNVCDESVPFSGVIEHTNFVDKETYGGRNVIYLLNYLERDHELFGKSKDALFNIYMKGLKKVFPHFNEKDILDVRLFKDLYATPVYEKGYSGKIPPYLTQTQGLYIANTSQIYPEDRNISNSIVLANKLTDLIKKEESHTDVI